MTVTYKGKSHFVKPPNFLVIVVTWGNFYKVQNEKEHKRKFIFQKCKILGGWKYKLRNQKSLPYTLNPQEMAIDFC